MGGKMNNYDFIIIGAGLAGSSVARELSRFDVKTCVLEKEPEVGCGITKGTHAIVHSGLTVNTKTPLKNRGEVLGCLMMEQLCSELDCKYQKIGKLLVAFTQAELESLKKMYTCSRGIGVVDVRLITDKQELLAMEPSLSEEVIGALYTPNTGIVSPWGLVYGLLENAVANGADLFVDTEVKDIKQKSSEIFEVKTNNNVIYSKCIINAAGRYADKMAQMIGDDTVNLVSKRQQKIIIDKNCKDMINHVVRRINERGGVADFISPTVYGDLMAGVDSKDVMDIEDVKTTCTGIEDQVVKGVMQMIPAFPPGTIIRPFSGNIIQTKAGDYYIKPSHVNNRFIHFVLGGSGLTAAYPMARYIALEILPNTGVELSANKNFNPIRKDMPHINEMTKEQLRELVKKDHRYGHIICRCETVSEGEIIEAIKRGARTVDGVKFRTRAGMGRCQGGFCGPRVISILARELNMTPAEVTKNIRNSKVLSRSTRKG